MVRSDAFVWIDIQRSRLRRAYEVQCLLRDHESVITAETEIVTARDAGRLQPAKRRQLEVRVKVLEFFANRNLRVRELEACQTSALKLRGPR